MIRLLTETDFKPLEILFRFERPEYHSDYQKVFRAPLRYSQSEDSILLAPEQMRLPIPGSQPYLKPILQKHADELLASNNFPDDLKSHVQQLMCTGLPKGVVDIDLISEKLHMSRWTLTRKLKDEGTTFKLLLKETRKNLAQSYLRRQTESITEIAFLLGYSEASAFQRAFKSWTSQTPLEYRQAHSVE